MLTPKTTLTPLIVANWKMQLDAATTVSRIQQVRSALKNFRGRVQLVICPSFPALGAASKALQRTVIKLGAQNVFWDEQGAYTGEVSPAQLREHGVEYVIIGHSERRQLLNETDDMVSRKMIAATAHGLTPILCVGETADERHRNDQDAIVRRQLGTALRSLPPPTHGKHVYIAYEPIWAIGTGEPADPAQTNAMLAVIRHTVADYFAASVVHDGFRVLYGGSVDPENILNYVYPGGFSGALIGTASLDPLKLANMVLATNEKFSSH